MFKFLNYFSKEVNLLLFSIFLFATAMGIDFVTFPTILTRNGFNASDIGIAFALEILGGIITSFFLSNFVAKLGMMRALKITSYTYGIIILLIYFCKNFWLWIAFVFAMGCSWFIYVITRQSWLNMILKNHQRGVAIGIFSMLISAGFAIGPIIVRFCGAENYLSFLISSLLVFLSFFLLKHLPVASSNVESRHIPLKEFFKHNPRAFMTRFFLDFQTYLLLTFTVIFGRKIGLSYELAGLLITAYMSTGFFDVFVGFLLQKTSPYKLINIGFLVCLYSFISIALYNKSYLFLLISYFTFGLGIACIYVSVFKVMNEDYEKEKLVAANATFQLIGSLGALCSSLFGGFLVDIFGIQGFPIAIILGCVFYLSFLVTYKDNNLKKQIG